MGRVMSSDFAVNDELVAVENSIDVSNVLYISDSDVKCNGPI